MNITLKSKVEKYTFDKLRRMGLYRFNIIRPRYVDVLERLRLYNIDICVYWYDDRWYTTVLIEGHCIYTYINPEFELKYHHLDTAIRESLFHL